MALQAAVDRYVVGMKSIEQLRQSYGEYGRGRLAVRLLRKQTAGETVDQADLAQAVGSGLFTRERGNPGHIAAIRPAIVLGTISTFEGFVEDFLAEALAAQGHTLARIAQELGGNRLNNPSLANWETLATKYFQGLTTDNFSVTVDRYTRQTNFHTTDALTWADARNAASGWMTVRHIVTHGGATGLSAELWPPPIRPTDTPASEVLKPEPGGKLSLRYRSAIGAARIYVHGARHLADQISAQLGTPLDWTSMPDAFAGVQPP